MKKYNNFLFENRKGKEYGRSLDIKDLENYINKYCSDFSWGDLNLKQ